MYLTACVICVLFPKHCQPNYHVIQSQQSRFLNYIYIFISKQNAIKNNTAISKQWNSKLQNHNLIKGKIFNQSIVGLELQTILYSFRTTFLFLPKLSTIFHKTDYWRLFSYFKPILSYKNLSVIYNIFQRRHYKFQPIRSDNSVIKKTIHRQLVYLSL